MKKKGQMLKNLRKKEINEMKFNEHQCKLTLYMETEV